MHNKPYKTNMTYQKFLSRWEEVLDIPPQRLGPFTPVYKSLVGKLKVMPWPWFLLLSVIIVTCAYLFVGSTLIFIVSLLQRGF